jgi:glutamyl-tRNA synthetase/glutamyl-Q tRNA(Asp) synthetase
MRTRTRFAPSLTGYLHLGHVFHMIQVWGAAREEGGLVVARIEDHDRGRARPEYETAILEDMEWLGFIPDLGIRASDAGRPSAYRQSDGAEFYAEMLLLLQRKGLVYGCECSRKEILSRQTSDTEELCYRGTCSQKNLPLEGYTVRFRTPPGSVVFDDRARGACRQIPQDQCGDFSLRDRHGHWTYQFCCVCDDIRQQINLVVRGEDILASTGRQIMLFDAFEKTPPRFCHHRLLCDRKGRKLSKRQRARSITQLREEGATAEQIIGRAAHAAGLIAAFRPLSTAEAVAMV